MNSDEHYNYHQEGVPGQTPIDVPVTYNVFVGDLNLDVIEEDLKAAFSPCGPISSALVFRDKQTKETKGFGFVNFKTKEGRDKALTDPFVRQVIRGRACRVRPEQKTTLFVGNLAKSMSTEETRQALAYVLGNVPFELEMKTGPPPLCESRGFSFVTFPNFHVADKARKLLAVANVRDRTLNVSWAEPQDEVDETIMQNVKTLYISNIPSLVSDAQLSALCAHYGEIVHSGIVKNNLTQESKGFAFVEFNTREECLRALESLNGSLLEGQSLRIVLAKPQKTENKFQEPNAAGPSAITPVQQTERFNSGLCYKCGQPGHIAKDCNFPSSNGMGRGGYHNNYNNNHNNTDANPTPPGSSFDGSGGPMRHRGGRGGRGRGAPSPRGTRGRGGRGGHGIERPPPPPQDNGYSDYNSQWGQGGYNNNTNGYSQQNYNSYPPQSNYQGGYQGYQQQSYQQNGYQQASTAASSTASSTNGIAPFGQTENLQQTYQQGGGYGQQPQSGYYQGYQQPYGNDYNSYQGYQTQPQAQVQPNPPPQGQQGQYYQQTTAAGPRYTPY